MHESDITRQIKDLGAGSLHFLAEISGCFFSGPCFQLEPDKLLGNFVAGPLRKDLQDCQSSLINTDAS